jgi:hypothetical protein
MRRFSLVAPGMQSYEHRQPLARWITLLMAAVAALIVALSLFGNDPPAARVYLSVVLAIVILAWWMNSVLITRVDGSGVTWSFAWGWPGGKIPFDRIARAERTRLNLIERGGAGWHWTVWHGWLSNAGGAEAIEIFTTGGGRTTLGTDDPQGLLEAIDRFRRGAA